MWKKFKEEIPKESEFLVIKKNSRDIIIVSKCNFWGEKAFQNEYGSRIYEEEIEWWHELPEMPDSE